ncbi:MAG TPA: amidase, partial [Acidimicrobiales bacterium]|nr:amidase [Acidimicrobiales bacterium]
TDLHYLSATEALAAFRAKTLSPVELMEAVLARADEVDGAVNALCHRFDERALDQSRQAEARYLGRGEPPRPLEGIPMAVKEEEAVAGEPWTQGSLLYKDTIAPHSSPFAERILESGAIVHARSTAPEFSCAGFTHSRLWGVTRNPWNLDVTVGGSSGGSGAALASGTATLASGSDIGGSIRIPASYNGVVGFKPPYGRVPQDAPFNYDTFCHVGPMARTVADCAAFQNAVAGPHPRDHVSLRPRVVIPDELGPIDGMRIAVSLDLGSWALDDEIAANTMRTAEALRTAGAVVEEVDLQVPRELILRVAAIHFNLMFAAWIGSVIEEHGDLMTDYAIEFPRSMAEFAGDAGLVEELTLQAQVCEPVGALLDEFDALVCPTLASRGLTAGESYIGQVVKVGDTEVTNYFDTMMTAPFNVLSRCPVLAVPSGVADNGVPTGVQIVGRTYDDETVFRIGAALERVQPWFDVAARRPAL